jgi:hypothetical protein
VSFNLHLLLFDICLFLIEVHLFSHGINFSQQAFQNLFHFCRLTIQPSTAVFSPPIQSSWSISPTSDTSCHIIEWLYTGFGLVIGFIEHLQNVTTNNYDSLTQLHIPKITVTTAHIKSSQFAMSSPVIAWWWITAVLLHSHSYWLVTVSQLTHCSNCRLSTDSH